MSSVRCNKKVLKTVLSIVLMLSIIIAPCCFASAASNSDLQSKINNLEQKQAEIKKKMSSLKSKKAELDEKKKTQQQLVANMQELVNACNAKLSQYNSEIASLKSEITKKENEIENTKTTFKRRIRAMYMSGMDTSSVSLFLNSDNFSDILAKNEVMANISSYDKVMIEEITEAMKTIQSNKKKVEEKQKGQKAIQQKLSSQLSELNSQLSQINSDVNQVQSDYNDAQQKNKNYQKQIAQFHAQMQRDHATSGMNIKYSGSKFLWPLPGVYTISSGFGYRSGAYSGFHSGVDLSNGATYGKTIIAAADGVVDTAGYHYSYGNYVVINHGRGSDGRSYKTLYAHMCQAPSVSAGQSVKAGTTVGYVGSTGDSTGPHLHFSVMVNGSFVNPMGFFN